MHEPRSKYIFSMSILLSMKCLKKTKKTNGAELDDMSLHVEVRVQPYF